MKDQRQDPTWVRIGMLSFAHMHAASYAASLKQLPNVSLAGIYDEDRERGEEMASRYQTTYMNSPAQLLDEELDAVIVCSENARHRSLVELAAGRVDHILCEKPIATTLDDARAMIDICAGTGTHLQIAFPVRFSPSIQKLKQLLEEQVLGRLFSVKCTNHGSLPGGWFVDGSLSGGGAVIDHTVHVIDLLRWFWNTEVAEVYAEVGDSLLHPGLGIDDAGLLSFVLANGVYGTLDTSWSRPSSYPTWSDVKIEVLGEKGQIKVDAFGQHLAVSSDVSAKTRWVGWGSNMDLGLIADFVSMIREKRPPAITGTDGLRALEVALAAYRSARAGQPVHLPLDGCR